MTSDQFCLKWNNYQASLTNAFKSLLENEDFVDVSLSAGGKTLRAHKVVLSACSSYFKQLLTGELEIARFGEADNLKELLFLASINKSQQKFVFVCPI